MKDCKKPSKISRNTYEILQESRRNIKPFWFISFKKLTRMFLYIELKKI